MYKGWTQTTKTSTKIQTKRTKKHRTTEEEMEGPTSSGGSRNRLTCLTLQEHDDDDDDDVIGNVVSRVARQWVRLSGVRVPLRDRDFLLKNAQTVSGVHPASYTIGTG